VADLLKGVDELEAVAVLVGVSSRDVRTPPKLLPRRRWRLESQVTTEAVLEMLNFRLPGHGVPGAAR